MNALFRLKEETHKHLWLERVSYGISFTFGCTITLKINYVQNYFKSFTFEANS